jgi:hypothetical protein
MPSYAVDAFGRLGDLARYLAKAVIDPHTAPGSAGADREDVSQAATSEFARLLLAEARDEIGRADQKASIMLAGAGVAIAAIVQGLVGSGWKPNDLGQPWTSVWWLATAASMAGLFCLVQAVIPRTRAAGTRQGHHIFYFENVADYAGTAELQEALLADASSRLHRAVHQLWHVSRIVRWKYRWIRRGLWLLGAAIVLTFLAVVGSDWG